ncbi:MAG: glycosyltransferase family 2 protein [Gemmatimonadaceae bacterium]
MKSTPALSVVLPVYNQDRYIGAAVQSVLRQTFQDFELLVVDDGSTDRTPKILDAIADPRLRIIKKKHAGFIQALRTGIQEARAPWVARMDSDDVSSPNRFETEMAFLANHPECVFVGSVFGIVTPNDYFLAPVERFDWRVLSATDITCASVSFADPSTIFCRRTALQSGLYDEAFPRNETPLWYKMLARGNGVVIGEPLHYVRWRLGSMSRADVLRGWFDNRDIRRLYHPESNPQRSHRVLPPEQRARVNAAARCQNYYLLAGDIAAAREVAKSALRQRPLSSEVWKMLLRGQLRRPTLRRAKSANSIPYRAVAAPW